MFDLFMEGADGPRETQRSSEAAQGAAAAAKRRMGLEDDGLCDWKKMRLSASTDNSGEVSAATDDDGEGDADGEDEPVETLTQGGLSMEYLRQSGKCPLCLKRFEKIVMHVKGCAVKHNISTQQLFDLVKLQYKQDQERAALGLPAVPRKKTPPPKKARKKVPTSLLGSKIQLALALSASLKELSDEKLMKETELLVEAGLDKEAADNMRKLESSGYFRSASSTSSSSSTLDPPPPKTSSAVTASTSGTRRLKPLDSASSLLSRRTKEERERILTEKVAIVLMEDEGGEARTDDGLEGEGSGPLIPKSSKLLARHNKEDGLSGGAGVSRGEKRSDGAEAFAKRGGGGGRSEEDPFKKSWKAVLGTIAMSDVTVIVKDDFQIPAHKLVLYARCPAILDDVKTLVSPDNTMRNVILWKDVSKNAALAFLEHIYCDSSTNANELTDEHWTGVKALMSKYGMDGLKRMIKDRRADSSHDAARKSYDGRDFHGEVKKRCMSPPQSNGSRTPLSFNEISNSNHKVSNGNARTSAGVSSVEKRSEPPAQADVYFENNAIDDYVEEMSQNSIADFRLGKSARNDIAMPSTSKGTFHCESSPYKSSFSIEDCEAETDSDASIPYAPWAAPTRVENILSPGENINFHSTSNVKICFNGDRDSNLARSVFYKYRMKGKDKTSAPITCSTPKEPLVKARRRSSSGGYRSRSPKAEHQLARYLAGKRRSNEVPYRKRDFGICVTRVDDENVTAEQVSEAPSFRESSKEEFPLNLSVSCSQKTPPANTKSIPALDIAGQMSNQTNCTGKTSTNISHGYVAPDINAERAFVDGVDGCQQWWSDSENRKRKPPTVEKEADGDDARPPDYLQPFPLSRQDDRNDGMQRDNDHNYHTPPPDYLQKVYLFMKDNQSACTKRDNVHTPPPDNPQKLSLIRQDNRSDGMQRVNDHMTPSDHLEKFLLYMKDNQSDSMKRDNVHTPPPDYLQKFSSIKQNNQSGSVRPDNEDAPPPPIRNVQPANHANLQSPSSLQDNRSDGRKRDDDGTAPHKYMQIFPHIRQDDQSGSMKRDVEDTPLPINLQTFPLMKRDKRSDGLKRNNDDEASSDNRQNFKIVERGNLSIGIKRSIFFGLPRSSARHRNRCDNSIHENALDVPVFENHDERSFLEKSNSAKSTPTANEDEDEAASAPGGSKQQRSLPGHARPPSDRCEIFRSILRCGPEDEERGQGQDVLDDFAEFLEENSLIDLGADYNKKKRKYLNKRSTVRSKRPRRPVEVIELSDDSDCEALYVKPVDAKGSSFNEERSVSPTANQYLPDLPDSPESPEKNGNVDYIDPEWVSLEDMNYHDEFVNRISTNGSQDYSSVGSPRCQLDDGYKNDLVVGSIIGVPKIHSPDSERSCKISVRRNKKETHQSLAGLRQLKAVDAAVDSSDVGNGRGGPGSIAGSLAAPLPYKKRNGHNRLERQNRKKACPSTVTSNSLLQTDAGSANSTPRKEKKGRVSTVTLAPFESAHTDVYDPMETPLADPQFHRWGGTVGSGGDGGRDPNRNVMANDNKGGTALQDEDTIPFSSDHLDMLLRELYGSPPKSNKEPAHTRHSEDDSVTADKQCDGEHSAQEGMAPLDLDLQGSAERAAGRPDVCAGRSGAVRKRLPKAVESFQPKTLGVNEPVRAAGPALNDGLVISCLKVLPNTLLGTPPATRARSNKSSALKVSVGDDITPRPDYNKMERDTIQKMMKKYGLKKSLPLCKARTMLSFIYDQTHPVVPNGLRLPETAGVDNGIGRARTEAPQHRNQREEAGELVGAVANERNGVAIIKEELLPLNDAAIEEEPAPPLSTLQDECFGCVGSQIAEDVCSKPIEKEEDDRRTYQALLELENVNAVTNKEPFDCPICFGTFGVNEGIVLRECFHTFCRECLSHTVEHNDKEEVQCPFRDLNYICPSTIQEREIKEFVTPEIFERHLAKSLSLAENNISNAFHCKTPDCSGWCIFEDNVNVFQCPICHKLNCILCQAIHEGMNCVEYQNYLVVQAERDPNARKTLEYLTNLKNKKKAINCPMCSVIIIKAEGCDWVQCSVCRTEICWATLGPRWGPKGRGDITGGCKCNLSARKPCHPNCKNCH